MLMSNDPKVSVIMPVHNSAKHIGASIRSILSQSHKNLELIIVNDGSTDKSEEIINSFASKDKRIKYYVQEHKGVSTARNAALKASDGEWIVYLDSDDIAVADRIERCLDLAHSKGEKCLIYGGYFSVRIEKGVMRILEYKGPETEGFDQYLLQKRKLFECSTVMHHRECLDQAGFFDEHLVFEEDWDMWLKISDDFHVFQMNEPLGFLRESDEIPKSKIDEVETIVTDCRDYIAEKRIRKLLDIYNKRPLSYVAKLIFFTCSNIKDVGIKKAILGQLESWRMYNKMIDLMKTSPKDGFELLSRHKNDELINYIIREMVFDFPVPIADMTSKDFYAIKNILSSFVKS